MDKKKIHQIKKRRSAEKRLEIMATPSMAIHGLEDWEPEDIDACLEYIAFFEALIEDVRTDLEETGCSLEGDGLRVSIDNAIEKLLKAKTEN